jgi:hypothetical protein
LAAATEEEEPPPSWQMNQDGSSSVEQDPIDHQEVIQHQRIPKAVVLTTEDEEESKDYRVNEAYGGGGSLSMVNEAGGGASWNQPRT